MQKTLITIEQAVALCGPDERWELEKGELIKMAPAGYPHSRIAGVLAYFIAAHVVPRGLGFVPSGDAGFLLARSPDTLRAPDVAYVSRERHAAHTEEAGFPVLVPDLVVEVVSPNDRPGEVQRKARAWVLSGVRLVLVVYPDAQLIAEHRTTSEVLLRGRGEGIDFRPVFPDFTLSVDEVFEAAEVEGGR